MRKLFILVCLSAALVMSGCAGHRTDSKKGSIAEQSAKTKAAMSAYTSKTAPVANDTFLISDSEAANATKKVSLGSAPISTATQTALNGKANASAFASQSAFTAAWGWTPGGVSAWSDIQALLTGTGTYVKADGTTGDPPGSTYTAGTGIDITSGVISSTVTGTLPTATEGQIPVKGASTWEAVDQAVLAFTGNVSRNTTTGVVSVPVTNTATSGSDTPLTSGGAYTALGGKQDTLVSGTNIKTINSTSILGSGNIDITNGTGGYVTLSAIPYSDVACTTGQYGYYESTAYLCTGGFWTSKWTLTTHSNASPSTYTLTIDGTGWNGTDLISVGGSTYTADGAKTGLSGANSITVTPDTGREATCSGTGITGSSSPYSADMSDNRTIACTFSDIVAASFIGAPGSIEGFETPGITFPEITETDASGYINPASATAAHSGTYSVEFTNTATAGAYTHYIRADLGVTDSGYSLTWWYKTPNNGVVYSNSILFMASASADASDSTARNLIIGWDGNGTNGLLRFCLESISGGDTSTTQLSYNSWYRFALRFTNNGSSYLDIYNSANTLLETLEITAQDQPVRYFYWTDNADMGENTYLDEIQYDSTNP